MPRAFLLTRFARFANHANRALLVKTGNRNASMISAADALPGRDEKLDLGTFGRPPSRNI